MIRSFETFISDLGKVRQIKPAQLAFYIRPILLTYYLLTCYLSAVAYTAVVLPDSLRDPALSLNILGVN